MKNLAEELQTKYHTFLKVIDMLIFNLFLLSKYHYN